ncbi:MAG: signal peptide peptidase SppA [Acidobacteriota bacterium]
MKRGILVTLLVITIVVIVIVLIGGYLYYQINREPFIPENSFLKIHAGGQIIDNDSSPLSKKTTLRDLWYHIKRAKKDDRIKGILLKISYMETGFAKVDDIGRLIKDFRKSGKKVYAFIENGGLREYQLATYADKIFAYKRGSLTLNGLAAHALFLKNSLSKLGIKADFINIGSYKTGPNIFTKEKLTDVHKESLESLVYDIYDSSIRIISENRNIKPEKIKNIIEDFTIDGKRYLKEKFIDGLVYEDEVLKEKNIKTVSFPVYKETSSPLPYKGKDKIAVIFAQGEIHTGASGGKSIFGGEILGSDTLVRYLRSARKNKSVKGVVLRVDSPGGSPFASDIIRHESELLIKEKPLVISMGDVAASGGYMISLSSSKILSLPQTITGSIGVYGGKFVLKGFYDKIGVNKEIIKTSKFADFFSDYKEFTIEQREKYKNFMQYIYDFFLEETSKTRKMKIEDVKKVAEGRVWSGTKALNKNLVDQIGGISEAIEEARKLAKIDQKDDFGIRIYPIKRSFIDYLMEMLSSQSNGITSSIKIGLDRYENFFPAMIVPFKIVID